MTGTHFGTTDYSLGLFVGDSKVQHCNWLSDSTMVAKVSPGVQDDWNALLTIDGEHGGSMSKAFYYDPPHASSVKAGNAPAEGGTRISLFGINFGTDDYSNSIAVGNLECITMKWQSVNVTKYFKRFVFVLFPCSCKIMFPLTAEISGYNRTHLSLV